MSADLRTQILENAKFLFGPSKTFQIVTALVYVGQYGNLKASQAILVEVNDDGTFKTHAAGEPQTALEEALQSLHENGTKKIYEKLAESLEHNAMIEPGETVIEGTLGW